MKWWIKNKLTETSADISLTFKDNERKQFERKAKEVLALVKDGKSIAELPESDYPCLKYCADEAFVENVEVLQMLSGRLVVECGGARITKKGLDYIYPEPKSNPLFTALRKLLALVGIRT